MIAQSQPDTLILGAGIIGLSLALELQTRGHAVEVLDPAPPLAQASTAAAGMLAVEDPHNPAELLSLSRRSGSLYDEFLARVGDYSGQHVPYQTRATRQTMPDGTVLRWLEHSLDPRQLAPALLAAVKAAGVTVTQVADAAEIRGSTPAAPRSVRNIVRTTGAWGAEGLSLSPRKGQMLRVRLPAGMELDEVYRSKEVYVVPRTLGPQAGTALIGATVEDAGFDCSTTPAALDLLRQLGATLVPELADANAAPMLEAWAGLRPATPDGLPLLGAWQPPSGESLHARHFVAAGHFRNGILLAPATAVVLADLIDDRPETVDLAPFAPDRLQARS